MENGDVVLDKKQDRASCHLVRTHSEDPKENDWTCFVTALKCII